MSGEHESGVKILALYDAHWHGAIDRREFLRSAGAISVISGVSARVLVR